MSLNQPSDTRASRSHRWAALLLALTLLAAFSVGGASAQEATTPPVYLPPYEGQPPKPGQIGLMRTSREVSHSELASALRSGGCGPTTIAVTENGQWLTFVGAVAAPTFVNAPTMAALPTLAAGRGFFVRCEGPAETQVKAPIESVKVERDGAGYTAVIVSGLPSGCARFDFADSTRSGDTIRIEVWNRMPSVPTPCTAIYGFVTTRVPLPGAFVTGQSYTLMVNDVKTVVWAAGVASATAP